MTETDMMTVDSGSSTCHDRWSTGQTAPGLDTSQDCTVTSSVSGGDTTTVITRALETGDDTQDTDIPSVTGQRMYYAYGAGTMAFHNQDFGFFDIRINSDDTVEIGEAGTLSGDAYAVDDYEIHG